MSKIALNEEEPLSESARGLKIAKLQEDINKLAKKIQELADKKDGGSAGPGPPMDGEEVEYEEDNTDEVTCAFDVDETQYEVEEILNDRVGLCGQKEYRIKWVGYGAGYNEWIEEVELERCAAELIAEYKSRQVKKGGRSTRKIKG